MGRRSASVVIRKALKSENQTLLSSSKAESYYLSFIHNPLLFRGLSAGFRYIIAAAEPPHDDSKK